MRSADFAAARRPALRSEDCASQLHMDAEEASMVYGYHVIFGAYGFWLPNDPRGSWSQFVGSWELFRYDPATTTSETRSLAKIEHDDRQRRGAQNAVK